ncbi:MAG: DEAD/DEAH box helicase [Mollicutes bacterium]|nr:DEAD/DEAH box helicase [Mollicutes bacterium]
MDFITKHFKYDNKTVICGLTNELNVFYVLELFKRNKGDLVLLASSLYEANKYYNLLQTYTKDVLLFVMDDFLSTMVKAISPELKFVRLNTLNKLEKKNYIVVTNLMGYLKYLPSKEKSNKSKVKLYKNSKIGRKELIEKIESLGYHRESITTTTGEYSVRGMIVDIFLLNKKHPIRIEYEDNIIIEIRSFDEDTQISNEEIKEITITPITETEDQENSSLIDYLKNPVLVNIDKIQIKTSYKKLMSDILEYKEKNNVDKDFIFLLEDLYIEKEVSLNKFQTSKKDIVYDAQEIENFNQNYSLLQKKVIEWEKNKKKITFFLSSDKQIKIIKEKIKNPKIVNKKINRGFIIGNEVVISEFDIEKTTHNYKYKNYFYGGKRIKDYGELTVGDYIVHISHGIGVYNGIKKLTKNFISKDYIELLYLKGDKIYIPVEKINNIYKYSDKDGTVPKINALNSTAWLKTRAYVEKKVKDISKELIKLYKERILIKKKPYKRYEEEELLAANFDFELTTDQKKAINDIYEDLAAEYPMDRLLCGDVGFGKTEIALRAMINAVYNGDQVVYLCPTTILSKQQYNVAIERLKDHPITIALFNRFTTKKEENEIIDKLKKGTIDIVFGTHKLFNKKIKFKNLGLLVVDEEQRFGVKQKEIIKELRKDVNVLTLSATPIPRTLKMALSGFRDLSIIETPPINRYPVQTYVIAADDLIVKDAIYKELSRDGQIFVLYNNVENIERKTNLLKKLVGEEIRYTHGKMSKIDLENIMQDFIDKKFNILVCTTIIENGIDIPNVNTLIVYEADQLGLSQLYQLRGRVGRSDRIAYAYLLFNIDKRLNDAAIKRLETIKEFTALGSGYRIAMRDLSIRGAGDIFGSSQAGFIDSVGVALYTKMIEDEIRRQKGEKVEERGDDKYLINVDTHIEDNYVSDETVKIEIHQMINSIDSFDKFNKVKYELEDRFGKLNDKIIDYMYEQWFENIAKKINITKVLQTDRMIEITLPKEISCNIKGDKFLYKMLSISRNFKLVYKRDEIIITLYYKNLENHFIRYIVKLLNSIEINSN